ncbi:MAG TPA: nicotinamide riboside transporter PnuC [Spirochaetia bacterium]|nr:nicotinamide riboside transporter PnuC [Spirochaetia bacterium]
MSYLEFFGTLFTGLSVYLSAKNKVSSWPVGVIGIILYGLLFYQIQLYSDLFEQFYYFVTAFWGWWLWTHPRRNDKDANNELKVSYGTKKFNLIGITSVVILTISLSQFMSNIHLIFPVLFPIAASFPFMDAFTTAMSFVANIYLAKRKIENWYLWIIVDIIGVFLYYQKGVIFLSLLYFAFLLNAVKGLIDWSKTQKSYDKKI